MDPILWMAKRYSSSPILRLVCGPMGQGWANRKRSRSSRRDSELEGRCVVDLVALEVDLDEDAHGKWSALFIRGIEAISGNGFERFDIQAIPRGLLDAELFGQTIGIDHETYHADRLKRLKVVFFHRVARFFWEFCRLRFGRFWSDDPVAFFHQNLYAVCESCGTWDRVIRTGSRLNRWSGIDETCAGLNPGRIGLLRPKRWTRQQEDAERRLPTHDGSPLTGIVLTREL